MCYPMLHRNKAERISGFKKAAYPSRLENERAKSCGITFMRRNFRRQRHSEPLRWG